MNFTEYTNAIRTILVEPQNRSDIDFERIVPRMIEYAELRIYREMDFLTTQGASNALMTSGSRNVTVPTGIIIVNGVNLITPAGTTNAELGTRVPMERVSLDFINTTWPTAATTGTPARYALLSDTAVRVAPTPSGAFTAEFIGISRPTALSASNTTTFITNNMPDLFVAASLIFGFGYQRDFGAASNDPAAAVTWEKQYETLKVGVKIEELRRKAESVSWSPYQPSPLANQPRDRAQL